MRLLSKHTKPLQRNSAQGVSAPQTLPPDLEEGLSAPKRAARRRERIPAALREEIESCGRLLTELFGSVFASHPRLKFTAARLFAAQLPPSPQPPGRPGFREVTRAIALREKLRGQHPEWSEKQIWGAAYGALISNYHGLPPLERRDAEYWLRQRVHWRLSARRHSQRLKTQP